MNPRVKKVIANDDFTLLIEFSNEEVRLFDARPYLEKGIFRELMDIRLFKTARVFDGTVQWIHEQDLCPDTLYIKSTPVNDPNKKSSTRTSNSPSQTKAGISSPIFE